MFFRRNTFGTRFPLLGKVVPRRLAFRKVLRLAVWLLGFIGGSAMGAPVLSGDARILELRMAEVEIVAVEDHEGGQYQPAGEVTPLADLPAFCRVALRIRPSHDSDIRVEVWLPRAHWNGRFLGTGNGGSGGHIVTSALAAGLRRNYAVANTDLGTGPDPELWINHPERWADFGHRATHEMTVAAKTIVAAYYGKPAGRAYFIGASTGGQQALMEAQRYPTDYDGIIAGSPVINRTHLHAMFLWNWQAVCTTTGGSFTPGEVDHLTRSIVHLNTAISDGAPGEAFLNDPRLAYFHTAALPDSDPLQKRADSLQKIYFGPHHAGTGESIFTSPPLGSEATMYLVREEPTAPPPHSYLFRWVLGKNFDLHHFDFDADLARIDQALGPLLNATSTDLRAFRNQGGKLLMYCGTADAVTPFQESIRYYEEVVAQQGGLDQTQLFFRLFLVPGMAHGPSDSIPSNFGQRLSSVSAGNPSHDILAALEQWVELGIAPEQLIATCYSEGNPDRRVRAQRPLYSYPQFPKYLGGDPTRAESFGPTVHQRGVGPSAPPPGLSPNP
jgi:feruloyl esterase